MPKNERFMYVTDKDGNVLTRLRERDGIKDCSVEIKQNSESSISFEMNVKSPKYAFISNPENRIIADGRVYTALYDGESVAETKNTGNKNNAKVDYVELQYLLNKDYVTAFNSTTTYDHIDNTMVVILSGGIAPLVVNGHEIPEEEIPYPKGSAGYALFALLYDTEWNVDICDTTGIFDLETQKQSIMQNIKAVQNLWGGILIFDSINKTVSLRSEEAYKPYNGYSIRFSFNETGLERRIKSNLVTRLYVYGKDGLNIANSNNGKEYLENYNYTNSVYYGLISNNDISNVGDLILYGTRELEKMSKPQVTLKVSLIDRSMLEGGVTFDVSDIVDVADTDLSESTYQARVTQKTYKFFQPWDVSSCTLGDEEETFAAKIKYSLVSADKVNNLVDLTGKVSAESVIMTDKNGQKQSMSSYVELTNEALEAGFKVIGVDGYEKTGKTKISVDGIDVYNGGIVVRDRENDIKIYMDGETGNVIFSGDLFGASGTFKGALEAASGTFAGELQAATGSFSGNITAKSGLIGSWDILDGGIVNRNNKLALTQDGEIVAAGGNFQVDADGVLTAKGANLEGDFSATSENSYVNFGKDDMTLFFAQKVNGTDIIKNEMCISPTDFYFHVYSDDGKQIISGIEYSGGNLVITGKIMATSGEIGGWIIQDDLIKAANGTMVLHADGTIEGTDIIDSETGQTKSGKLISTSNGERTVITGGEIRMYLYNEETEQWDLEGRMYTNSNLGGGVVLSSVDNRAVGFATGGNIMAKIEPADYPDNDSGEARFNFRNGTKIYKGKVETGYIDETDPEWFSGISVSDTALVFTSGNRKIKNGEVETPKTYTFTLQRDSNGKITHITDESGNVTVISRS